VAKTKLKPCPFCGEKKYLAHRQPFVLFRVECDGKCGTLGPWANSKSAASRLWNTRAEVKE